MAIYLIKARPRKDLLDNLHKELSSGIISKMKPFGQSLQYSLQNAGLDDNVTVITNCHCPSLLRTFFL